MDDNTHFTRMKAVFDGDGTELRQQFIYAGLILTIFERFKFYVIDRVDGFFASEIEIKDGAFKYTRGDEFKKIVKEKGGGNPGQHANKVFRASLHWFHDLGALDKDDFNEIERLYSLRNEIGHELLQIIAAEGKSSIALFDVIQTFAIYLKIVRWWIKEVEATTDPDMDEERYNNTDWDNAETVDTIFLREIMEKALDNNEQWKAFKEMANELRAN
ncbi:MAG: hypothetical protein H7Y60_06480 [Rhodospirillaceae bacterium]|nr:hypothetical protein [Rhodospirillales bacterium]